MMATDLRQAKEYAAYMRAIGWITEKGMFIKRLPLIPFSFIKIQRQRKPVDLALAKKYQAVQIKIEPALGDKTDYQKLGFKPDKAPMLPTKTVWLDLTKSTKQLLEEMHYKTRYNIKKRKRRKEEGKVIRGDTVTEKQIREFYEIYKLNCQRQRFWGINFNQLKTLLRCFGKKAWLLASKEGGLIILIHNKIAYYSHNASTQAGREKFIPTLLTWEAVKLAKKLGCKRFDFEGITDNRFLITKKWRGFTKFKRSFGGVEVEYRGSLTKYRRFL